jgi:AbrB family looped-hinge helix DNA binding protein
MMPIATLTRKGQVTIPLAVRAALGLHTGDKLDFVEFERRWYVNKSFKIIRLLMKNDQF